LYQRRPDRIDFIGNKNGKLRGCEELFISNSLFLIAIGLFYLVYRLLKAEKDAALEILKYIAATFLLCFAVCLIIAAVRYALPIKG